MTSAKQDKDLSIERKIERNIKKFKAGAHRFHLGHFFESDNMQLQGWKKFDAARKALKALGPEAEQAYWAMLNDPDDQVRVLIACDLVHTQPDVAVPILEHIHRYSDDLDATATAMRHLIIYEHKL